MAGRRLPRIGLVWTQFAACHADRCASLAERLAGRFEVVGIEVATTSREYAAFASADATGQALKRTLFPGRSFESIPRWRRFAAVLAATAGCRTVCIGVPYSQLEFVLLGWILRLLGKQVVLLIDSKFDDRPRRTATEFGKQLVLSCFDAAIAASARSADYLRFLGFRRRRVLAGCDGISLERIRNDAGEAATAAMRFADRDFIFVGRFIAVKNLPLLIDAYADYVARAGAKARRLHLYGSGPLEAELRAQVARLGLEERAVFAGFRSGADLAGQLARSLALVLTSYSETWGMVVNEAAALGLPVIVTGAPGARDALVRNLVNGFVIENGSREGIARAMLAAGEDEGRWQAMRQAALDRAWMGDVGCFADAVELLLDPAAQPAGERMQAYLAQLDEFRGG